MVLMIYLFKFIFFFIIATPGLLAQNYSDSLFDAYQNKSSKKLKRMLVDWETNLESEGSQMTDYEKSAQEVLNAFFSSTLLDSLCRVIIPAKEEEYWIMRSKISVSKINSEYKSENDISLFFFGGQFYSYLKSAKINFKGKRTLLYNYPFSKAIKEFLHEQYFESDSLNLINMLPRGEKSLRVNFLSKYILIDPYPDVFSLIFDRTLSAVVISFNASRYISYGVLMVKNNTSWEFVSVVSKTIE